MVIASTGIRSRVILTAVFIVCSTVALGTFAFTRLDRLHARLEIATSDVVGIRQLALFDREVEALREQAALRHAVTDAGRKTVIDQQVENLRGDMVRVWAEYEPTADPGEERELATAIQLAWSQFDAAAADVAGKDALGRRSEAEAALLGSFQACSLALHKAVEASVDYEERQSQQSLNQIAAGMDLTETGILVSTGLITCLCVAIGWSMVRGISRPIMEMTAAMCRLADRDTDVEIPGTDRRDEIGRMAAAVDVFKKNAVQLLAQTRELRQTNLRFDAALRNMRCGLTMYDAEDRLVVINDQTCTMRDMPLDAVRVGMSFREVVGVRVAAGQFPGRNVDEVLAERRGPGVASGHAVFEEMLGERTFEVAVHTMRDGGWISTVEDVTSHKQAEQALREANDLLEQRVVEAVARHAETEAALRQSQKMEAVGQLTGGIAHDFNNMLASVSASLEVMQIRIDQGRSDQLDRYVGMAQDATRRAAALTHRLLAFSRRQTLDPRPTDVNQLVGGMEELICRTVGPGIRVEVVGDDRLWPTLIDASQLDNALLNLCINARDAMPGGGRLTIETMNCSIDGGATRESAALHGDYVALRVSDTGAGMPPDVIARAFDPFFTTKPIGQGTGLGLSMIYGFVHQSGGEVRITSTVGAGTQVCLYLPRHPMVPESQQSRDDAGTQAADAGRRTVLVVDDEPLLRTLIAEALESGDYAVIACTDSLEALRILESDRPIDLLITDVGLPGGMNGRQLADAARRTRARLPVLFMTGYVESAGIAADLLDQGMQVLAKPFRIECLIAQVKAALDEPAARAEAAMFGAAGQSRAVVR